MAKFNPSIVIFFCCLSLSQCVSVCFAEIEWLPGRGLQDVNVSIYPVYIVTREREGRAYVYNIIDIGFPLAASVVFKECLWSRPRDRKEAIRFFHHIQLSSSRDIVSVAALFFYSYETRAHFVGLATLKSSKEFLVWMPWAAESKDVTEINETTNISTPPRKNIEVDQIPVLTNKENVIWK